MKKDKKFLEELGSFLGESKHKDEIVAKYDDFIKSEKKAGKKIKDIIKALGDPEELAVKELEPFKNEKVSFKEKVSKFFKSLKKEKAEDKDTKKKAEKKDKKDKKDNLITRLKNRVNASKKDKKKETKKEENKESIFSRFKTFLVKDRTLGRKRKVTDSPKEIVEEVKEEVEDKIGDMTDMITEKHVFETKKQRAKRILLRTLGIILTCLLVFIWLWVTVIFFASVFAYLDGIKFKGMIIGLLALDFLILWIVIMINRAIFRKKMSLRLNLIIVFVSVALIALGGVMTFKEIKDIDYVQDVSEKYTMARKLETYELPKDGKFIITFNSNYNTQYVIKHDKNLKGKVRIETRYYEVYYDYYTKTNMDGVYVSLKLDDRDRFSVYLDDIKEGKIYDNDELSRYTVKITVNPSEANKIAVQ